MVLDARCLDLVASFSICADTSTKMVVMQKASFKKAFVLMDLQMHVLPGPG